MSRRRPSLSCTVRRLLCDLVTLVRLALTSRAQLAAENLFLRKQLALYQERRTKPTRPDPATRVALVLLSRVLDWRSMLTVVKPDTLIRTPQANAFCERLIGTMHRECLDWLIPLNERHLRWILREWVTHYNRGRPHASLGPGLPEPPPPSRRPQPSGHHLPDRRRVAATPILAGLHHEYRLVEAA